MLTKLQSTGCLGVMLLFCSGLQLSLAASLKTSVANWFGPADLQILAFNRCYLIFSLVTSRTGKYFLIFLTTGTHFIPSTIQGGLYNILCVLSNSFCYASLNKNFIVGRVFPPWYLKYLITYIYQWLSFFIFMVTPTYFFSETELRFLTKLACFLNSSG